MKQPMSDRNPSPEFRLAGTALRYLAAGSVAAGIDIFLFLVFARHVRVLFVAAALSFSIAAMLNYVFCGTIVYHKPLASLQQLALFSCFALIGLVVNSSVTSLSAEFAALPLAIAKISGIAAAFAVNFTGNTFLSFRHNPVAAEPILKANGARDFASKSASGT